VIALFTDGLTEAGPTRKDLLLVPGVVSVFRNSARGATSAGQIKARIMDGVESFATPTGIRDDVCLLVACVE
jgi:serine phosphatase RsbU (regulator of sigma subunit)